jgi:hypothetical protein
MRLAMLTSTTPMLSAVRSFLLAIAGRYPALDDDLRPGRHPQLACFAVHQLDRPADEAASDFEFVLAERGELRGADREGDRVDADHHRRRDRRRAPLLRMLDEIPAVLAVM